MELERCSRGQAIGHREPTADAVVTEDKTLAISPRFPRQAFAFDVAPGSYFLRLAAIEEVQVNLDVDERGSPMRGGDCQPAAEPLRLGHDFQTTLTSRWVERTCQGPWCAGHSWDVTTGDSAGALEIMAVTVLDADRDFSPPDLFVCTEPCPASADACEVVTLNLDMNEPIRTQHTFPAGAVLHLGAPNAPDPEHFVLRLWVAPEE